MILNLMRKDLLLNGSLLVAILGSIAANVLIWALEGGRVDAFLKSLEAARAALRPIGEFAKRYTLFFDANAHIDAAWLWRERETREVCRRTFSSVIRMMDARPEFTYTQSSALYYRWVEAAAPELFAQIQRRVREGRWRWSAAAWC